MSIRIAKHFVHIFLKSLKLYRYLLLSYHWQVVFKKKPREVTRFIMSYFYTCRCKHWFCLHLPCTAALTKVKGCYSRFHFHVLDYCQWLRIPHDLLMPHKQIELWGITSTSGHFRPYQIQTANIHFKFQYELCVVASLEQRN